jgi:hypothetical protein
MVKPHLDDYDPGCLQQEDTHNPAGLNLIITKDEAHGHSFN